MRCRKSPPVPDAAATFFHPAARFGARSPIFSAEDLIVAYFDSLQEWLGGFISPVSYEFYFVMPTVFIPTVSVFIRSYRICFGSSTVFRGVDLDSYTFQSCFGCVPIFYEV